MTPILTQCIPDQFTFGSVESRSVVANFNGGYLTSDGGLILLAELDRKRQITARFAACFQDYRDPARITHSVERLVSQRIYGLVQGYEDLNDHEQLRYDPAFGLALDQLGGMDGSGPPLAGKSTLNRLEHRPAEVRQRRDSRYHRIGHDPKAIEQLLVVLFVESHKRPPREIIIDLDVTDDPVHGAQELAGYNPYYGSVCYTPLYLFCGHHLLAAKLRPANIDPAAGALEELQRVIAVIRQHWPQTRILVRADSAYARDEIMDWCEAQPQVEYAIAMPSNSRLEQMSDALQQRALAAFVQQQQLILTCLAQFFFPDELLNEYPQPPPQVWYGTLHYQTLDSWSRPRRVVVKIECDADGCRRHFVVTSLSASQAYGRKLHAQKYCPRGDMENRIKEQKLDLASGRTSTHTFEGNQLRLWLASIAYVLMQTFRQDCLPQTALAQAQVATIRTHVLKLGARVRLSARRIQVELASNYPFQDIFATAYQRIQSMPNTS